MAMELSMRSLFPSRMKNFFQKYPERYAAESPLLKLMCTNIFASCPISIAGELTNSALSLLFSFGDSFSRSFNFLEKHIDLCVVRLPMDKPFDLAHEQFYCLSHFETKLK